MYNTIRKTLNNKTKTKQIKFYKHGRDSAVSIATGYGLDDRGVGVRVPVKAEIFNSPQRPDCLWGPHSLLSNGYNEISL
jgi:hypothetical protein